MVSVLAGTQGREVEMNLLRWTPAFLPAMTIVCTLTAANADVPPVVPPRLVHEQRTEYPQRAIDDRVDRTTTVVLLLVVDPRGAVTSAEVEAPQGHGFDEAAVEAARALVFEPATRDGVPIAARIRFSYTFDAPPAPPAPAPSIPPPVAPAQESPAPPPDAPPAPASEALAPEEVVVKGASAPKEPTRRTLTAEEAQFTAGGRGDALVALESMPGVGHAPPFTGLLIFRGSSPRDSLVSVDGTEVPLIYHLGGLSSVLPSEVLDRLDFYPGNFDATYGRGMGGVVEAAVREPRADGRFHGLAQLDLLEARALAEGPIAGGWSFLASARRSTFDLWLDPIRGNNGASVRYYDYQAEVAKDFDARTSLRVLFFGADDRLNQQLDDAGPLTGNAGVHTAFWRLQARFVDRYSSRGELRVVAAVGQDVTDQAAGPLYIDLTQTPISVRAEVEQHLAPWLSVRAGADVLDNAYTGDVLAYPISDPDQPSAGPAAIPRHVATSGGTFFPAAYLAGALSPWAGVRITPSVRVDYEDATKAIDVAPRLTVRQQVPGTGGTTTFKGGVGEYFQPPHIEETNDVFGQPGLRSNRSVQVDAGIEQKLFERVDLSMDAFGKWMDRLVVPGAGNSGEGRAYGAEWLLRVSPGGPFYGWIAYTLSRSERRDATSAPWHLFDFDQTHNLSVVASWRIDKRWRFGARFRFTSGNPYTPSGYGALDTDAGAVQPVSAVPLDSARLPPFHELDLRLDRTWVLGPARVTAYADIENIYSYAAPIDVSYNYNFTQHGYLKGFPILPGLGVRGEL
jgi:TonB family protein